HLQWWSTVPVPDEVLQIAMDDYKNSRVVTVNSIVGKYQRMPREPGWSDAEYAARVQEDSRAFDARVEEWKQRIPEKLDRFAVRDAVRMHLAWTYRYTLPREEQTRLEKTQITVGDITGTPAEVSTHFAMPGFAARHPNALTRLPDDNAEIRKQLSQLRSEVDAVGLTAKKIYVGDMVEQGYSAQQIDAEMRGEETGAPVGGRKALKSFKKG